MATLTIRNLPEDTKRCLRIKAAENGRSMEEEARVALMNFTKDNAATTTSTATKLNWVDEIRKDFADIGYADLVLPPREPAEPPLDFSGPDYNL
jgi:antitoxin FitA